ncbi:MAG TPA: discoidin domain-containing protein [Streptosporangiaceae bacterium]
MAPGGTLTVPTRRPDLQPTTDLARCQQATASSAQLGAGPVAAVDGSPATGWQPRQITSSLTVRLAHSTVIRTVTLDWGRQWPQPPALNVDPPPTPVITLRASSYDLMASQDGKHWTVIARVRNRTAGTRDVLNFAPVHARYIGLLITSATHGTPPMLEELTCE